MTGCVSIKDVTVLSDRELEQINGGKVFEGSLFGVTIQINPDSGCWALWYGKEFVGGGCKK